MIIIFRENTKFFLKFNKIDHFYYIRSVFNVIYLLEQILTLLFLSMAITLRKKHA